MMEKMLTTIMSDQKTIFGELRQIKDAMSKMLVLEEKQLNLKEALSRIGKHVDAIETRLEATEEKVTDLRIVSARLITKVSLIAGGSGAGVSGILVLALQWLATNGQ